MVVVVRVEEVLGGASLRGLSARGAPTRTMVKSCFQMKISSGYIIMIRIRIRIEQHLLKTTFYCFLKSKFTEIRRDLTS